MLFDFIGDILEVSLIILCRDQRLGHPGFVGCDQLLFEAADGQDFPCQGQLSRHSNFVVNFLAAQNRCDRRCHRNTRTWPILGCGTLRDMDMQIIAFIDFARIDLRLLLTLFDTERDTLLRDLDHTLIHKYFDHTIGDSCRLLHHIPETSRELHRSFAFDPDRFDRQDITAHGSPGEAINDTDLREILYR